MLFSAFLRILFASAEIKAHNLRIGAEIEDVYP